MWDRNRTKQRLSLFSHALIIRLLSVITFNLLLYLGWKIFLVLLGSRRCLCVACTTPSSPFPEVLVLVRMPRAEQPAVQKLPSAAVPGRWVLHHLLLFNTSNEPRRKKRGENDVLRNVRELRCCVSPVLQWSSFSVVLFLTVSSRLFFCSSPLILTALKLSLIEDSRSFYFGRRKDGKSSMQATHEWKTHFYFLSKILVCS